MEPNQQNIVNQPVSPLPPKSRLNLRSTIAVGILMLLIGLGGGYLLFANKTEIQQVNTAQISPTIMLSPTNVTMPTVDSTADWKTYDGSHISFRYPQNWNPAKRTLFGGAILEDIVLNIPGVESDNTLGFSDVEYSSLLKPNDVTIETAVVIGGRSGVKWIRKGDSYISYDYLTYGSKDNKDSFSVHVTVATEDKNLEMDLDKLVDSLEFKAK